MKKLSIILFILIQVTVFSQHKGATPIQSEKQRGERGKTYAVVVGISDYQDPGIPDLRFADKDAEAFANFLRSPAGGSLDRDHLKVLINSAATMAQFANALDWLLENAKENDRVFIYFSGHGDVEKKTMTQPGYLLCWDAPARVYLAGGALALPMFEDVISTLTIQSKAKVVVITDACHSGKLSGSSINGAQATAGNLAKQYANEIKILSCQPNEYAIEGEQWGGGRGAFSFNLVDALYGLADGNKDLSVTLQEVGRYLEDHVTFEVAPVSQVPMVLGNRTERLASVDAKLLADIQSGKTNQMAMLSPVEMRGMEEEVLAGIDTAVQKTYHLFLKALKEKMFLEPIGKCADFYYQQLISDARLERLHSTLTRNYAAALQDDSQQVLNTLLKTGLTKEVLQKARSQSLYRKYPLYLQRAAELLGESHYMYVPLQARKYFFEGKIQSTPAQRQAAYHQALTLQSDLPHVLCDMITVFDASQKDSAVYYANRASSLISNWILPYILLAEFYEFRVGEPKKVDSILQLAYKIDSNSVYLWYVMGGFYSNEKRFSEAEKWYLKVIQAASNEVCFPCAYNELAVLYMDLNRLDDAELNYKKALQLDSNLVHSYCGLGQVFMKKQKPNESEASFLKALSIDPNDGPTNYNLGDLYFLTGKFDLSEKHLLKALNYNRNRNFIFEVLGRLYTETGQLGKSEEMFKKALELDPKFTKAYSGIGIVYMLSGRLDESENMFKRGIEVDPANEDLWYNLTCLYAKKELTNQAFEALEKSFQIGFNDFDFIQQDPDLENLRKHGKRWAVLMRKYFPDKVKD